ncbi:leucine-rich receptor-like protein kinase family protein [Actinidia rufa]|uniref:Leucine-rich receptor-like protein kinase family protein n=1 Tax=Actinidia rufa TaxID=165716 RepID=A0A7J0GAU6_9ERIC|nr:leucine-rich receptor-like protein kinase family protein [Actinidia rufa]
MVFKRTMFLYLLQYLVIISGRSLTAHQQHHHRSHDSLETDRAALLAFKRTITSDPNSSLANWNRTTHVCKFSGVRCNKQHHRVTQIVIHDAGLVGLLSPVISNLTRLRVLDLVNNRLFGTIPWELSSLRHLRRVWLEGNHLQGQIPDSFSLLASLLVVNLRANELTGIIPASLFSNCTFLRNVDLSANFLEGKIPPEIGNCPGLWNLNLYNNKFTGEIPFSITNASSMYNLDVEYNHLSGELPTEIVRNLPEFRYLHLSYSGMVGSNLDPFFTALGNCTFLEELELAGMKLQGRLPSSIGKLVASLATLMLQENRITGSIPPSLSNITSLVWLNLTSNLLSGTIPEGISQLSLLEQLFLSHNFLSGQIPAALGQFQGLGLLDLSHNRFSGAIPASLGYCTDLFKLDLSYNRLNGTIPPEISGLREIRMFLNLSHNHLEGPFPIELSKLENVQEVDLSSNNLTGSVFPQISNCIALRLINISHNFLQGQLPESLVIISAGNVETERKSQPELIQNFPRITYKELSDATGGFDQQRLLGSGSYGHVYKGVLPDGTPIAVKPSNVLLNDDMTALVSDFGIARLVMTVAGGNAGVVENMGNSTANMLSGSIGYIAPEYGFGSNTNTKGDVYSFGILVLEMVTRKRPTDDMFVGALSLHRWVKSHYHGRVERVIDSSMVKAMKDQSPEVKKMWEVAIGELMELGMLCTQDSPNTRPTMLDAADDLDRLKRYLTGDSTATFASSLGISSSTIGDD